MTLDEMYKKLNGLVDDVEDAVESAANSWLARYLDLDEAIRTAGDALVVKLREFLKKLHDFVELEYIGNELDDQVKKWEGVIDKLHGLSDTLDNPDIGAHLEGSWSGLAWMAYNGAMGEFETTAGGMADAGVGVQGSLRTVHSDIKNALVAIALATMPLVLVLAATILAIMGVITAPAAIPGAGAVVTTGLATLSAAAAALYLLDDAVSVQTAGLDAMISKLKWPQPGVAAFDTSSDWRPKLA